MIQKRKILNILRLSTLTLLLALSGCGGGGGNSSTTTFDSTYSATLAWDAPTTNEDATCLEDLAAFKIYYGTLSEDYTEETGQIPVSSSYLTCTDTGVPTGTGCPNTFNGNYTVFNCEYTVQNLTSGTWCFVATAYDTSTNESANSNEACADI